MLASYVWFTAMEQARKVAILFPPSQNILGDKWEKFPATPGEWSVLVLPDEVGVAKQMGSVAMSRINKSLTQPSSRNFRQ